MELAFIYGVAASEADAPPRENADDELPDIDLIVVGTAERDALTRALDEAAERLGRDVVLSFYTPRRLRSELAGHNRFLLDVLD